MFCTDEDASLALEAANTLGMLLCEDSAKLDAEKVFAKFVEDASFKFADECWRELWSFHTALCSLCSDDDDMDRVS